MSVDLKIELKDKKTVLKMRGMEKATSENLRIAISRGLEHYQSKVDKNIASGKFGIKTRKSGLRASLAVVVKSFGDKVTGKMGTNLVYAKIQEEGGRITVTRRMAAFAWHKWYDTGLIMWKAIALKKGRQITIPAHWYMRNTFKEEKKEVLRIIQCKILEPITA